MERRLKRGQFNSNPTAPSMLGSDHAREHMPVDVLELVAHDMVQPLHSIKLQLDVLADRLRSGNVPKSEVVRILAACSARSSELADQLRSGIAARRGGASAYVVHVSRCDLGAIANDVIKGIDLAQRERIVVSGIERSLEGYWDGERITQVLRELVENALKYSAAR